MKNQRRAPDTARLDGFEYTWLDDLRLVEVRSAVERDGLEASDLPYEAGPPTQPWAGCRAT